MKLIGTFLFLLSTLSVYAQQSWKMYTIDNTSFGSDGTKLFDANGDGLPDIICGWEQGNVARLYFNPANPQAEWPFVEVPAPQVEDALLADLDSDGFAEIITLCEGKQQSINIHWGPADPIKYTQSKYWQTTAIPCTVGKTRWMFGIATDVDGKNGMDLVVGSKAPGSTIGWLEAPSNARKLDAWAYHEISPAGWVMSIIEHDMDHDGRKDILISDRYGDNRGVRWLKKPSDHLNQGWDSHTIGLQDGEPMFLTLDGNKEIYAPDLKLGLLHFQQTAAGHWKADTIAYPSIAAGSRGKAVSLGDINLDGIEDIVISFEGAEDKYGLIWRDGKSQQAYPLSDKQGNKFDLVLLIDMDYDQDLDILTSEENNNSTTVGGLGVVWYENPTH